MTKEIKIRIPTFIQNHLLVPEAIPVYAFIIVAALVKHNIDVFIAAQPAPGANAVATPARLNFWSSPEGLYSFLMDHAHTLIPLGGTLFSNFVGLYFNRLKEARELERMHHLREIESLTREMELQHVQGDQARLEGDYYSAIENFSISLKTFEQIYQLENNFKDRPKILQLYVGIVYRYAVSLFYLDRLDEAIVLLKEILDDAKYTNELQARVWLLNLGGLIYFKKSNLFLFDTHSPVKSKEYVGEAIAHFEESYRANKTQNCVYFYLQYLKGNYTFLAENIPYSILNPKTLFTLREIDVVMQKDMLLIFADSCYKNKEFGKAIYMYQTRLTEMIAAENTFPQLFSINLECFKAYNELISKNHGKQKLPILQNNDGEKSVEQHIFTTESKTDKTLSLLVRRNNDEDQPEAVVENLIEFTVAKKLGLEKFNDAKRYLMAELDLDTDPLSKRIVFNINHAYRYKCLYDAHIDARNGQGSASSDLIERKQFHLQTACKLLEEFAMSSDGETVKQFKSQIQQIDSTLVLANEKTLLEDNSPVELNNSFEMLKKRWTPHFALLQTVASVAAIAYSTAYTLKR